MTRKKYLGLAVIAALLASLLYLLPKTNCCDKPDVQFETLTAQASAGQLDAIEALYAKAKMEGVEAAEEHWALEGALRGDVRLRSAYVGLFEQRFDVTRRQQVAARIKERWDMPGAPCLIESIKADPLPGSAFCN